jgi:hypothetical protein
VLDSPLHTLHRIDTSPQPSSPSTLPISSWAQRDVAPHARRNREETPMARRQPPALVRVEAGAEPWSRIEPLLDRRLVELAGHGEIELLSAEPQVLPALVAWCAQRGLVIEPLPEDHGVHGFRLHRTRTSPEEDL